MNLEITFDTREIIKNLTSLQKKEVPFSTALALTSVASGAAKNLKVHAQRELDRPIPFTLAGFKFGKANKVSLESTVYIMPIQWGYLKHQVALSSVRYPKQKFIAIPVEGVARTNKYGNVYRQNRKIKMDKNMFIARIGGVSGIWERGRITSKGKFSKRAKQGDSQTRLVFSFKNQARYERRFHYYEHVSKFVSINYKKYFEESLAQALRTSKWA